METQQSLKHTISNLPKKPGVYQFLNKNGGIIYIGKAKNLRARVKQYFQGTDERLQIPFLLKETADITYTVTNNELEALYLENTLIKQHLPKYNILLRDDKNYAFIMIDYTTEIPQIKTVRKVDQKSAVPNPKLSTKHLALSTNKFFGPYTAAYKIRNTLNTIRKIFSYCSADHISNRPCFYYYLHRCPGVCIGKIPLTEYQKQLNKIKDFLNGNTAKVKKELNKEMQKAAQRRQFETAARLRDQINALKLLEEKQIAILTKKVDWDIVSIFTGQNFACVNLFKVREGKLRDKENFVFKLNVDIALGRALYQQNEILQTFLEQYYLETSDTPKIIYAQIPAQDPKIIEHIIRSRFNQKTEILTPQKGQVKSLINLGQTNAQEYLKNWLTGQAVQQDKIKLALTELKNILNLPVLPKRIEGFDISNIQGTNAVGSMVVFVDGLPAKSQYRKFRIRGKTTPDDFTMMKEMLTRRMSRISNFQFPISKQIPKTKNQISNNSPQPGGKPPLKTRGELAESIREGEGMIWPTPDLIVIDGGKGQLNAALAALRISNFKFLISKQIPNSKPQIPIIGLAKRLEEIYLPNKKNPIILPHDNPALQILQRLRDEAHRFGITFHRNLRSKQAIKSALDEIPGVGPKTKKLLKQKFGTVREIQKTPIEELEKAVGKKIAEKIKQNL